MFKFYESPKLKFSIVILLISWMTCSSCAWFQEKKEKTAKELVNEGINEFNNGNYEYSINAFEKLKDWYPFSKFAVLAEIKIADANFRLKKYEEAARAYKEFTNLHPTNEAVPYAIYQNGLCYFNQVDTVDRDQSSAKTALDIFNRLIKQFPKNIYVNQAKAHKKKCLKSIAGHELYVGLFYFKTKHYKAALNRFKSVVCNYPDVGVHKKALRYIPLCEEAMLKSESS